jgi:hypothetical protein
LSGGTQELGGGEPIFVVGPSRSGTTLLQEILNRHPALWIARETHYFDDLRPRLGERALEPLSTEDAQTCERYFLALGHRAYGHEGDPAQSQIEADELRAEAERLGGSADAYFEAFCRVRTRAHGKSRWGEKTPRHVFRINEILAFSPRAKVVCLVRDPRAVAASYRDWKRERPEAPSDGDAFFLEDRHRAARSYNVVVNALLWKAAMRASTSALARHGHDRIYLLHYEGLVENPDRTLRGLADWLGVIYETTMLDVPVAYSSYEMPRSGISTQPLERWREKLTATEISAVQTCCGRVMTDLGYRRENVSAPLHRLVWTWATVPTAFARAALANRKRLGRASEYVRKRLLLTVSRNG